MSPRRSRNSWTNCPDSKAFADYRTDLARHFRSFRIAEAAPPTNPEAACESAEERLVQCIWYDSLFVHHGLKTNTGKTLEIVEPGRWNEEAGPDFRDARLRIDGQTIFGDVEIHTQSNGWRQHRHHLNSEYDSVVLHAFLHQEGEDRPFINSRGHIIEGFEMAPVLFPDLEAIRQTLHVEDYPYRVPSAVGRCQPLLISLDEDYLGGLLDAAGQERIERKVGRLREQSTGQTVGQVLYQAIMTSMGHKANKGLFFLLSKRAPLHELLDYLQDIGREHAVLFFQSVLLNVARLVPTPKDGVLEDCDDEIRHYLEAISKVWGIFAPYFSDRLIPPTRQWVSGVRPVNFAHRRLGGIAHVLARLFLDEPFTVRFNRTFATYDLEASEQRRKRWIQNELIAPFVVDVPDDFWASRFTCHSKRSARPMKLIGQSRAASIVFNGLLPILLLEARREANDTLQWKIQDVLGVYPKLESNSITRHMNVRLFGDDKRAGALINCELRQQALFQIFSSFCNHDETGCDNCCFQDQTA